MSYDNVCKSLAEKYPTDFVRWLLPGEKGKAKVLKTELSLEPIHADSVIFLQTENRILHIEFQTRTTSNPTIPFRMLDYSVRLKRLYNLPVTQIVIFLQETDDEMAYTTEYVDETTTHHYQVIRIWEQDSAFFIKNKALLPLAPLTRTDSPQSLLSQVAEEIAKISNRETKQNIVGYTGILAGLRLDKDFIRQLLSEDIMQDSVIYQDILQKGEQRGEQRGLQRGEQIGKQQEAFHFLNLMINRRFGEVDSSIIERLRVLPTEQLEILGVEFLDFDELADLCNWLDQQENH